MNRLAFLPFLLLAAPAAAQGVVVKTERAPAPAEARVSSRAANAWLDKAESALHVADQTWSFEQKIKVKLSMGSPDDAIEAPMVRAGTVAFTGAMVARLDAAKILDFPGMPEPMRREEVIVFRDGVFYVDRESMSPFEERALMSITLEDALALQAEQTGMPETPSFSPFFDSNPLHASPGATMSGIRKLSSFEVAGKKDGQVTLSGKGSATLAPAMGPGAASAEAPPEPTVTMLVDEATGRPLRITIGDAENPTFEMSFSNFVPTKADAARFDLNPEGKDLPSLKDAIRREMEMRQDMARQHSAEEEF
ncbi:MAG TPA: hypothetical protein VGC54_00800 [Planctomycetota bacterium]